MAAARCFIGMLPEMVKYEKPPEVSVLARYLIVS
jgi:hypothetical protein